MSTNERPALRLITFPKVMRQVMRRTILSYNSCILVKILARIAEPQTLNPTPYTLGAGHADIRHEDALYDFSVVSLVPGGSRDALRPSARPAIITFPKDSLYDRIVERVSH